MMHQLHLIKAVSLLGLMGVLTACNSDDDTNSPVSSEPTPAESKVFEVSIANLTAGQALSPVAISAHSDKFTAWQVGEPASVALEELAEGGATNAWIEAANNAAALATLTGSSAVEPGATSSMELSIESASNTASYITLASMLIRTNDGFTGAQGLDISNLEIGDKLSYVMPAYDAGTEFNDELAEHLPGPDSEGFNADRTGDRNTVSYHSGTVTQDDGYAASALNAVHRFDNPVAKVTIVRTQ